MIESMKTLYELRCDVQCFVIFCRFTPNDLCNVLKEKGRILGLVVDFTNTERYYKPKVELDSCVVYFKNTY